MPRSCTICTHPQREAIETALVGGASYRAIAAPHGLSPQAVMRHKQDHLPDVVAAARALPLDPSVSAVTAAVAAQDQRTINVRTELETCFARINKVFDACDAWLTDPDDPTKYDIGPRANEVDVVYEIRNEDGWVITRKHARLSWLLAAVETQAREQGTALRIVEGETKIADPRKLILDAATQLKGQLEFLVSAMERTYNVQQMELFEAEVVAAIQEADPATRDRLVDRLKAVRDGSLT